ncbi:hypothetical protein VOLCADRAFT_95267 [Volvox carteri f. nagariensis]|uniref:Uncharacterized protein n=1 Tax=Volvox carteri f. nagariensis TaxID=3068 RepID=D8U720_VOLCA|nr:uncharacterized protein VOLCADRAFT_95267 [Volvox carteri f. nagariensis]EFJ44538.1 hypothetical protein VOLCADRAFT_95267 [Volvox carteri f. nagariensis]|eukprot:XP_002954388.1 hypothetical protein VOLCADRAFT_95267 [Volvox carteri f. nagariensis]
MKPCRFSRLTSTRANFRTRVLRKCLAGQHQATCFYRQPCSQLSLFASVQGPCSATVQKGPCNAPEPAAPAGSVRRVMVSRHAAAVDVLRRVTQQATIPVPTAMPEPSTSDGLMLRFPALEFRSLLLNALGRDTFPERAVWKRHKVSLCALLLHLDDGDLSAYTSALDALVGRICMEEREGQAGRCEGRAGSRQGNARARARVRARARPCNGAAAGRGGEGDTSCKSLLRSQPPSSSSSSSTVSSGASLDGGKEEEEDGENGVAAAVDASRSSTKRQAAAAARTTCLKAQIDAWCRAAMAGGTFSSLRSLLERVMEVGEPAPLVDIRRNGSHTELQVAALMSSKLPPDWRLICGATILAVDGQTFVNRKRLKGEADLLLVDPDGVVQAVVEVKTAKGNPYVALYDDIGKLLSLLRAVRDRSVTFRHGASPHRVTTLDFAKRLRPIYVLGCGGAAMGLKGLGGGGNGSAAAAAAAAGGGPAASVLRSAWSKLLTVELGRELSAAASAPAWSSVKLAALSRETVVLQLTPAAYEPLARRVAAYFARLAHCEVYLMDGVAGDGGGTGGSAAAAATVAKEAVPVDAGSGAASKANGAAIWGA